MLTQAAATRDFSHNENHLRILAIDKMSPPRIQLSCMRTARIFKCPRIFLHSLLIRIDSLRRSDCALQTENESKPI